MILPHERLHHHIGIQFTGRPLSGVRDESFPRIVSGVDDHQEGPDILTQDFTHLRDG